MALFPNFIAGSYAMRAPNIDVETTINLFPGTLDIGDNAKQGVLYGTPGLRSIVTAPEVICRVMFYQDGRTFTVIGSSLYEATITGSGLTVAASLTRRGSLHALGTDGLPVYMASNGAGGHQLAIVSAGKLYIFDTTANTLSGAVTTSLTGASGPIVFLNGYFLMVEVGTIKFWYSALEDGTSWPGANFIARSNASDNIVGMAVLHDQLKIWGSKTAEWFYDSGNVNTPFLPYPGSVSMDGAVAAAGCGVLGETLVWVATNERNLIRMMSAGTGEASVISTPAVEFAWASYSTVSDVELLCYEQEGHPFVCVTFPTADVTWVYDLRETQWHQRDSQDTMGLFHRWRVRGTCAPAAQAMLVGDYQTGDVYALQLDTFTDNGTAIRRLRRAPYLSAENQWLFLDQIELGLQAGVGTGATPAPQVKLRLSRDFGNTYSAYQTAGIGAAGAYQTRAIWRGLGRSRADQLVVEVTQTDPVRTVWGPGLYLRTTPGSGLL